MLLSAEGEREREKGTRGCRKGGGGRPAPLVETLMEKLMYAREATCLLKFHAYLPCPRWTKMKCG